MCSRPVLLLGKYNSRFRPLWHRLRPVLLLEPDNIVDQHAQPAQQVWVGVRVLLTIPPPGPERYPDLDPGGLPLPVIIPIGNSITQGDKSSFLSFLKS